jgi:hypothetical protein
MNYPIEFKLMEGVEDIGSLNEFRNEVYYDKRQYLLNGRDTLFDSYSYNFVLLEPSSKIIGASRCTPYRNNRWEASDIVPSKYLNFDPLTYVQYNRVVIKKEYQNKRLHEYMFHKVAFWIYDKLEFKHFFSICEIPLLRTYSKFNIRPVGDPFSIASRNGKKYCVVQGNVDEVISTFKEN